jgi:4-hydroxy-3-methylbut-2-enyl diphosphate reductase
MKINLAKSAGFCFGVRRAIQLAFQTADKGKTVHMLGDIVHNEEVVKQIRQAGVHKTARLKNGKNNILLIRAHGTPPSIPQKAIKLGYKIVDATCPMVKEIHKIVRDMERKGYKIIVIGDKFHDEVRGIVGQLKNRAIVIDNIKHIPFEKAKKIDKGCVVVQSTQNLDKALKIVDILERYVKELVFFNTICKPTRMRQDEMKKMPLKNDIIIIIGSKKSANTKRLFEISRSLNKHSYWVTSQKDIKQDWFKKAKTVGITAGASTPNATTQEVISYISKIN